MSSALSPLVFTWLKDYAAQPSLLQSTWRLPGQWCRRSSIRQERLLPYECPDDAGSTTAACIQESRVLLKNAAPLWFGLFDDLSRAINYLEDSDTVPLLPDCLRVAWALARGSSHWHQTVATLKFLQYRTNPTTETREPVREAERLFGAYLDLPPYIPLGSTDPGGSHGHRSAY